MTEERKSIHTDVFVGGLVLTVAALGCVYAKYKTDEACDAFLIKNRQQISEAFNTARSKDPSASKVSIDIEGGMKTCEYDYQDLFPG